MSAALLALLLLQAPTTRAIAEAQYARAEDASLVIAGLQRAETSIQRVAARAAGRLERASLAGAVVPLLKSPDREVRREAVLALAQMGAPYAFAPMLGGEADVSVRAAIYDALGRAAPAADGAEGLLASGLRDAELVARVGAARGLDALVRGTIKTAEPSPQTIAALRAAIRDNRDPTLRELSMLALNAASDQDPQTFATTLADPNPLVRRLSVIGSKRWTDDPSPIVRFEAMRLSGTCDRAKTGVNDASGHVALAAVDVLGAQKCDAAFIESLVEHGKSWRIRAHAIVSLAKVAPEMAGQKLKTLAADPVWQVRAYAASAAVMVQDEATLALLARDANPNVAAAALTSADDAVRALLSDHAGLLVAAAARLKWVPELRSLAPQIATTVRRLSRDGRVTTRDPRVALIERLREAGDEDALRSLEGLLADPDPVVASLVSAARAGGPGIEIAPKTTRYVPEPFPSDEALAALRGATAFVTMKGLGAFTLQLFPEEAPATVATFVDLAKKGTYNGLTFHRVVPNFVLQGGSPGANEYDALTRHFMRDEVGMCHQRGTIGISTRGRDTGDGQIFINLVDNFRLDHLYTVFAKVTHGMDVVDQILEGDVIESVVISTPR